VNEKYEEIVFFEPTESFAYILDKGPKSNDDSQKGRWMSKTNPFKGISHTNIIKATLLI
jgi:hypothetical protein